MGQNPRSKFHRHHAHSDRSARSATLDENDLFTLLDRLEDSPFLLILDGIQDPHNLGAILRTADGAGVHAVVSPKDRSVSLTDTVRRIACGAAEHVAFIQVTNLARTVRQLKERGIWIIGTSDHAEQSLFAQNLTGPLALVVGFEGKGLRRLTGELCDSLVAIPMFGSVESLNVSVATGICLFEAIRQRRYKGNL